MDKIMVNGQEFTFDEAMSIKEMYCIKNMHISRIAAIKSLRRDTVKELVYMNIEGCEEFLDHIRETDRKNFCMGLAISFDFVTQSERKAIYNVLNEACLWGGI